MDTEPTTNRLSSGYGYDRAGNVTSGDSYVLAYDPLGQTAPKTYTGTTTTFNETYIYTAGDERIGVQTSNSSGTSRWWYWSVRDEGGKVLRQFRSSANDPTQAALWIEDYVYRDGQLVGAERPPTLGGRRHFHLDHLGSPRLITSDTGLIVSTHDYLPFGGESSSVFQETGAGFDREDPMKFTGHERDYAGSFGREDGHAIDYMHARYYNGGVGRFLSVDSARNWDKALASPQAWNRYAYARNSPLSFLDPNGLDDIHFGGQTVTVDPGGVLYIRSVKSGDHVATYVRSGSNGEIIVVDNTSRRNANFTTINDPGARARHQAKNPDNTGNKHLPHDLKATVNGKPNPFSPDAGARVVGVIAPTKSVSGAAVVTAAANIQMFHDGRDQCTTFVTAVAKEAGYKLKDLSGGDSLTEFAKAAIPVKE